MIKKCLGRIKCAPVSDWLFWAFVITTLVFLGAHLSMYFGDEIYHWRYQKEYKLFFRISSRLVYSTTFVWLIEWFVLSFLIKRARAGAEELKLLRKFIGWALCLFFIQMLIRFNPVGWLLGLISLSVGVNIGSIVLWLFIVLFSINLILLFDCRQQHRINGNARSALKKSFLNLASVAFVFATLYIVQVYLVHGSLYFNTPSDSTVGQKITVITTAPADSKPLRIKPIYETRNESYWCKKFNPFQRKELPLSFEGKLIKPLWQRDHTQEFMLYPDEVANGVCDWKFSGFRIVNPEPSYWYATFSEADFGAAKDRPCLRFDMTSDAGWLIEFKPGKIVYRLSIYHGESTCHNP